ncbi:MAG: DUF2878 domain-containing protein [Gammaproteobacteria bacterium]|nr:DUF2878 domain-containing protein [Gammaproteobacteria bacterium]
MLKQITNLILFKAGWLACILLATAGLPGFALLAALTAAMLHLAITSAFAKETLLLAVAGLAGLTWETILQATGLVSFRGHPGDAVLAPLWMGGLWLLFATTINHGLRWSKRSFRLSALVGAVSGPIVFLSGSQLGLVTLNAPLVAVTVIGLAWSVLLPALNLAADAITDSTWFENAIDSSASHNARINRFIPAAPNRAVYSLQSFKPYY